MKKISYFDLNGSQFSENYSYSNCSKYGGGRIFAAAAKQFIPNFHIYSKEQSFKDLKCTAQNIFIARKISKVMLVSFLSCLCYVVASTLPQAAWIFSKDLLYYKTARITPPYNIYSFLNA